MITNNSETTRPVIGKTLQWAVALILILTGAFLFLSLPPSSAGRPASNEVIDARVERVQGCAQESTEADFATIHGHDCQIVLVELLAGSDAGQLVSLSPLLSSSSGAGQQLVEDDTIMVRSWTDQGLTKYRFAERTRTVPLFAVIAIGIVLVLATGHWFGFRSILVAGSSLLVLTLFSAPAIAQGWRDPAIVSLITGLLILAVILLTQDVRSATNQLVYLSSAIALSVTVALGAAFIWLAKVEDPLSIDLVALSSSGASGPAPYLLLSLTVATVFLIHSIAKAHVTVALEHQSSHEVTTFRSLVAASIRHPRQQLADYVMIYMLASISGLIPLLLLFTDDGVTTTEALNNEPFAGSLVRITAGMVGLSCTGFISAGIAALITPNPIGAAEMGQLRPPIRRKATSSSTSDHFETVEPSTEKSSSSRLRAGVDDV